MRFRSSIRSVVCKTFAAKKCRMIFEHFLRADSLKISTISSLKTTLPRYKSKDISILMSYNSQTMFVKPRMFLRDQRVPFSFIKRNVLYMAASLRVCKANSYRFTGSMAHGLLQCIRPCSGSIDLLDEIGLV